MHREERQERVREREKERQRDRLREKDKLREREKRTCSTVFEGHGVTLGQSLLQLSQDLLVPILSEPHHLQQTKTYRYTYNDKGLYM